MASVNIAGKQPADSDLLNSRATNGDSSPQIKYMSILRAVSAVNILLYNVARVSHGLPV